MIAPLPAQQLPVVLIAPEHSWVLFTTCPRHQRPSSSAAVIKGGPVHPCNMLSWGAAPLSWPSTTRHSHPPILHWLQVFFWGGKGALYSYCCFCWMICIFSLLYLPSFISLLVVLT